MNLYASILKAAQARRANPQVWQPAPRTLASAEAYRVKRARMGDPNFADSLPTRSKP